jgi:hypothetical protein
MITAEAVTLAQVSSAEAAITYVVSQAALPRALVLPKHLVPTAMTPTQAAVAPSVTNTDGAISAQPSLQTSADASVAQLLKLSNLDLNWDGYGAAKPKLASIFAARSFIRSLAPESIVPQPALHADGNAILFFRAPDAYVELEFVDQKIEFYARRGQAEWADEIQPGGPLPVALSEIGFST